ncbi:hypothetical protein V6N13_132779 [Hibiscus sabdariffa]
MVRCLDAFIANKKNKENKRFGFVRVPNKSKALRMIEKMNRYRLYGNILTVSLAKYRARQMFRKKVNQVNRDIRLSEGEGRNKKSQVFKHCDQSRPILHKGKTKVGEGYVEENWGQINNNSKGEKKTRISGHIESEDLWKLKGCLIGEMATVTSVDTVRSRLNDWGMGEIKVKRLGGKCFLLRIEDPNLYKMPKDLHWTYLKRGIL